jgi:glycosyltransferase involved in cell wall biosynthesis
MSVTTSIIVASYNQVRALSLVLESLRRQSEPDLQIVVGDDGSEADTAELVRRFAERAPFPVTFVTQPDLGFRKAMALNNAIRRAQGERLLFLDGDCLAPRDWARRHVDALRDGAGFSVGGYVRLDLEQSQRLTPEQVADGRFESCITLRDRLAFWQVHAGHVLKGAQRKLNRPSILGGNFAATREAIWAVDGFDESYEGFSKEDSDIRNRLKAAGYRGRSLWHDNWVFHCAHELDPRRGLPAAKRGPPDREYYHSRKGSVRATRGLSADRAE